MIDIFKDSNIKNSDIINWDFKTLANIRKLGLRNKLTDKMYKEYRQAKISISIFLKFLSMK